MRNAKAIIQYDGTNYQGWQIQATGRTIQGELTRVVSLLDHRHVNIHGAGRTDSGVHALGQVASFAIERDVTPRWLRDAINGNLDRDIRVREVELVTTEFHARLSAKQKTYEYRIWTGAVVSPFAYRYVYHCRASLNVDAMRRAADALTGEHDFSAFTGIGSLVESTVRTLKHLSIEPAEEMLVVTAQANGFLRYMVRTIVGTLLEVGRGDRTVESVAECLASRDRGLAGQTAPACGLTLMRVDY